MGFKIVYYAGVDNWNTVIIKGTLKTTNYIKSLRTLSTLFHPESMRIYAYEPKNGIFSKSHHPEYFLLNFKSQNYRHDKKNGTKRAGSPQNE